MKVVSSTMRVFDSCGEWGPHSGVDFFALSARTYFGGVTTVERIVD